jgi:murein DD-endopeptidase MepM/ murein hydrolase activator NlpD
MTKLLATTFMLLLLAAGCSNTQPITSTTNNPGTSPVVSPSASGSPTPSPLPTKQAQLQEPISGGLSRVTKKPFGIYITPKTSPVQPEKFTGYHTGIDFETTSAEANIDVPIMAACNGKLLMKKYATGYGGVSVQSCVLNGNAVTIIYGHLRLSSITPSVGDSLKAGDKIAFLGTGYSSETDGERKHLHFGIHVGTAVNILGYVQTKTALSGWLDAEQYLK